jgi:hypothetical protein
LLDPSGKKISLKIPTQEENDESSSLHLHSSESLLDADPFAWEIIRDQFLTSIKNTADQTL